MARENEERERQRAAVEQEERELDSTMFDPESVRLSRTSVGLQQSIDNEESSIQSDGSDLIELISDDEEEPTLIRFTRFLEYLYEESTDLILSEVSNLDNQLDFVPVKYEDSEPEMTLPSKVVELFLAEVPIGDPLSDLIYNPGVDGLLSQVINEKAGKDAQMLQLQAMATSVGDCPTPVKELLVQLYIGKCLEDKISLFDFEYGIIEREAIQKHMVKELNSLLKKNPNQKEEDYDKIEQVNGLLNAIYNEDSENDLENLLQIVGNRQRLPSKSHNVDYGYEQVAENKELIKAFAKMVCKTNEQGEPIMTNNEYTLDNSKIGAISEEYIASMGFVSEREKKINSYGVAMGELINLKAHQHLSLEHFDHNDVEPLLNTKERKKVLRALLLSAGPKELEKTYATFLKNDKEALKKLSNDLKVSSALKNGYEAMGGDATNNHKKAKAPSRTKVKIKKEGSNKNRFEI